MPGTPATTPKTAIPRYANTDSTDFAGQVNAISDRVDTLWAAVGTFAARPAASATLNGLRYMASDKGMTWQMVAGAWVLVDAIPVVAATPPASPVTGQLWEYDASGIAIGAGNTGNNASTRWVFKYDGTRWVCMDGGWVRANVAAQETGAVAWSDLATVGPRITIPAWGAASDWHVRADAQILGLTSAALNTFGVTVGAGTPLAILTETAALPNWGTGIVPGSIDDRMDAVASGGEIRMRYSASTGTPAFSQRRLRLRPISVG